MPRQKKNVLQTVTKLMKLKHARRALFKPDEEIWFYLKVGGKRRYKGIVRSSQIVEIGGKGVRVYTVKTVSGYKDCLQEHLRIRPPIATPCAQKHYQINYGANNES